MSNENQSAKSSSLASPSPPAETATATPPKSAPTTPPPAAPPAEQLRPKPLGVTVGQRQVMVDGKLVPMPDEHQTPIAKGIAD